MIYLILLFITFNDPTRCLQLIEANRIKEAHRIFLKLKDDRTAEKKFLDAYFSRDAIKAFKVYESLYQSEQNNLIHNLAKKKLYEFYYTKGLYQKAETYRINDRNKTKTLSKRQKIYLQCGVFTAESNAIALKEKLKRITNNTIKLIPYNVNGKNYIRVIINGFRKIDDAEKLSGLIHQKLLINSIIKTDLN